MSVGTTHSGGGKHLRSELAQYCLPAAHKDKNQKLAWVNSLCMSFMIIGVVGLKPPPPVIRELPPLELPMMAPIEPPPQQVTQTEEQTEEPQDQNDDVSDAPAVVAVTLDSPAISFSVPTVGNVLVSSTAAQAPPPRPMQALPSVENKVVNIRLTGRGGSYPQPSYPDDAYRAGHTASMFLLISVDANGTITGVEVEKKEGNARLVDHAVSHVKRKFMFPTAEGPLTYRIQIVFQTN